MPFQTKRVYEVPEPTDGLRYFVERLWPRGFRKDELSFNAWLKDLAPSIELRRWYGHEVGKFAEFRTRYRRELDRQHALIRRLKEEADTQTVTLLYATADREHCSAKLLREYLEERRRAPRVSPSYGRRS